MYPATPAPARKWLSGRSLVWQSRLVPRTMSILGLIGGPALLVAGVAVLFDFIEAGSTAQVLATWTEWIARVRTAGAEAGNAHPNCTSGHFESLETAAVSPTFS